MTSQRRSNSTRLPQDERTLALIGLHAGWMPLKTLNVIIGNAYDVAVRKEGRRKPAIF